MLLTFYLCWLCFKSCAVIVMRRLDLGFTIFTKGEWIFSTDHTETSMMVRDLDVPLSIQIMDIAYVLVAQNLIRSDIIFP
jgi:hypothetical protein